MTVSDDYERARSDSFDLEAFAEAVYKEANSKKANMEAAFKDQICVNQLLSARIFSWR